MHRLDLGLYSHPKEFLGGMEFEPMLTPREKSPLPKMSPEEDRTRDAVDSEPKHYQLSYSGPGGQRWCGRYGAEWRVYWPRWFSGTGFDSRCLPWLCVQVPSHTRLNADTAGAALPGTWRYGVGAGTGWLGVSILGLGGIESFICELYISVAARRSVGVDPSLRYTNTLRGMTTKILAVLSEAH